MYRLLSLALLLVAFAAPAQGRKVAKEAELKKKETNIAPDKSLAGDVTRKVEKKSDAPTFRYDQFRLGIELQVASKRREQIDDLKKIIELNQDKGETPTLLFRLGELYWEESKFHFFEANRKDDDKVAAIQSGDEAAKERAEAEKQELLDKSKEFAQLAVTQYARIVQEFQKFERTDEVLYFLGLNLMDMGDERRAVPAYKRLIDKYKKSRYLPDSYLALGEYYFNNSKARRDQVEKALDYYQNAAKFPENEVYGYALYKQGWCHFNLADYEKAMDMFKSVVLYAKFDKEGLEGSGKKGNRKGLAKEARNDYVRAYSRTDGTAADARSRFQKLADNDDELRTMMKQLAGLLYEDGKDKEAALAYNMLIKERPLSPEAPGFQGRIVDIVMRTGNKRITVQQVRRLVKVMDDVVKGNKTLSDKDKKALDEARDLSERTISNLAVNWHNEAKKTRDDETFGFANEVYADYLTLFPDSPKAYDLRFFWAELLNDNLNKYDRAAEEYTRVALFDIDKIEKGTKDKKGNLEKPGKPGKWMNNATYNSILAWDEVVKADTANGKIKQEAVADPNKALEIPPQKKALLDACERYLKYIEKGEKKVEIAYKAAKIYYDYNHLDEAVNRFADLALKHPDYKFEDGGKVGEIAANLVLDSYNLLGDWSKVNEWARKFYAEPKLATGKFRADLAALIEQSAFKLINQAEAKQDYAKAGDAYVAFVAEFPKSDLADKALYNAQIDFYNAKMLDKAIEVRKRIIQEYKKSQYVPQVLFALAEAYEAIADFDKAADYYEQYADEWEDSKDGKGKSSKKTASKARGKKGKKGKDKDDDKPSAPQVYEESKAQDALFNSGIFREGLGEYKKALRNREKYLALWPKSKDAESVFKTVIELYEKMGNWKKALDLWEEYERQNIKDPTKVLTAEGRIATIFESKLKKDKDTRRIFGRILQYHGKLSKKQQEGLDVVALDAVGRASYVFNEDEWRKYSALKLKWTKLAKVGELKASIKTKATALQDVQKTYTQTVKLKSADPAICALHKIGLAYDQFYEALKHPPVPKGIPEDLLLEVQLQFEQEAAPIKIKATEAFSSVVQKSQELDVFNPCTIAALKMLRTKYAPEQFPKMGEDVMELKLEGGQTPAIGQGILTAIQPIPVVSAQRAAEMKSKAAEVGRDLADLGSKPPPDLEPDAPPPDPSPAPRGPSSSPDTEPEEPL